MRQRNGPGAWAGAETNIDRIAADINRLSRYAALVPAALRAYGGDRFPPIPMHRAGAER
jgi:hypothetical protein